MRFLLAAALIVIATNTIENPRWAEVNRTMAEADFIFCETWSKFVNKHPEIMKESLPGFRSLCHSF